MKRLWNDEPFVTTARPVNFSHSPLSILHVCSSLSVASGGVARAVLDSAFALAKEGTRVSIVSYAEENYDFPWGHAQPANLNLRFCELPSQLIARRWITPEFKRVIAESLDNTDVVHLHGMWEPLTTSIANQATAREIPYVCSIHGMLDSWSMRQRFFRKRVYYSLVERKRLAGAAAIHFTAEQEKKKAAKWIPANVRTLVLPLIVDLAPYLQLPARDSAHALFPQLPSDKPWVLFLSRIHEKKGLDLLISAFAKLRHPDAQLVVAGSGEDSYVAEMKQLAGRLCLSDRVHFVGLVKGENKTSLYRRADVLVLPSSQENFGLVVVEALACGTPVLITAGIDIYEEILQTRAGALITRDPANIAAQIDDYLENPESTRSRGEAGREWAISTLSPTSIAERWLEVYRSIRTRRSGLPLLAT